MVGMSKSGSRYGRRSNWFKIHCLLQEQEKAAQQTNEIAQLSEKVSQRVPLPHQGFEFSLLGSKPIPPPLLQLPRTKEELMFLGLDEYKQSTSPSAVSLPESHKSDSSTEVSETRSTFPFFPGFLPPAFLPPPGILFPTAFQSIYTPYLQPANNNNNLIRNHNQITAEFINKRLLLESQRPPTPEDDTPLPDPELAPSPVQDDPIDLSMKSRSERSLSPAESASVYSDNDKGSIKSEAEEESNYDTETQTKLLHRPLDLTAKA